MLSSNAVCDQKVALVEFTEIRKSSRGQTKSATRYLALLKTECEKRKLAWEVYRAIRREAKRHGLIPQ